MQLVVNIIIPKEILWNMVALMVSVRAMYLQDLKNSPIATYSHNSLELL